MNVYENPAQLEEKSRMNASSVLVVLSGGQDSTTCLFHAIHSPTVFNRVGALSFDYGQRHSRELDSAAFVYELAHHYIEDGIHMDPWIRIKRLGNIFEGTSPLTTNNPLEEYSSVTEMDAKLQDRVELTFVPGRNAVFLALAYSYATAWGYDAIMTGVNAADAGNYPDCTPAFVSSIAATMELATRQKIHIYTPLQGKSKKEIVELGNGLAGCMRAMAFTTTDYAGAYPPLNNHASVLRASGFSLAKTPDPLIERAKFEGVLR
jgi:7-cyano-7-deazaguanine synthase